MLHCHKICVCWPQVEFLSINLHSSFKFISSCGQRYWCINTAIYSFNHNLKPCNVTGSKRSLGQDNVFTPVCQSFCSQGECLLMGPRGICLCSGSGGVCTPSPFTHTLMDTYTPWRNTHTQPWTPHTSAGRDGHWIGRYASSWNAFLFPRNIFLQTVSGWIMERMGNNLFCPLFIGTMLNNNCVKCKQGLRIWSNWAITNADLKATSKTAKSQMGSALSRR